MKAHLNKNSIHNITTRNHKKSKNNQTKNSEYNSICSTIWQKKSYSSILKYNEIQ